MSIEMKIVSEEEAFMELNAIVNHDMYNMKTIHEEVTSDFFLVKEYAGFTGDCNDITLDIKDIKHILHDKDFVAMSSFEYVGLNSAQEVIKSIILDFEEHQLSLIKSDGILVYFQINSNYSMMELAQAMEIIHDKFGNLNLFDEPDVIFGTSCNNNLKSDYIKVTVFVGYSKKESNVYVNNFIK